MPYLVEQIEVNKKSFWVLFYSAKYTSDQWRLQKIFEFFSQKVEIFVFRPPHGIGEKSEVNKKSLLNPLS